MLTSSPRWKEESAIDFTYTSAQIEGNTYTRADTITLLKEGITAGAKSFYEATMILNLRDTYRIVLDKAADIVADPLVGIRAIHRSLMKGLLPENQLGHHSQNDKRQDRRYRIHTAGWRAIHRKASRKDL